MDLSELQYWASFYGYFLNFMPNNKWQQCFLLEIEQQLDLAWSSKPDSKNGNNLWSFDKNT